MLDRELVKVCVREVLAEIFSETMTKMLAAQAASEWMSPTDVEEILGLARGSLPKRRRDNKLILGKHYRQINDSDSLTGVRYEYSLTEIRKWIELPRGEQEHQLALASSPSKRIRRKAING